MTVDASSSRQGEPAETEASLRKTLRGQIEAAQSDLSAKIAQLRNAANADTGLIAQGDAQLGELAALQGQIESANPMALAMMSAQIAASVAAANTLTQQVQAASTTAQAALASARTESHRTVGALANDFYEKKIFDKDLRFTSAEDEEAYRRHEAEYERYIKEQSAKGTPEGDLNAALAMRNQMIDAGEHGALADPEWQRRMNDLDATTLRLSNAVHSADPSTEHTADTLPPSSAEAAKEVENAAAGTKLPDDIAGAIAALKSAGVQTNAVVENEGNPHGLAANDLAARNGVRTPG